MAPLAAFAIAALSATFTLAPRRAHAQVRGGLRVGAELEPVRRLELQVYARALFGYRVPDTGRYQTQLEASYALTSFLQLGGGYRLALEEGFGGVGHRHRLHVEGRLHTRWRVLRFAYRLRLQGALEPLPMYLDVDASLRNRLSVGVRLPFGLGFDLHGELYSQLDAPQRAVDRLRFEAEAEQRIGPVRVGVMYRYDSPVLRDSGHPYHLVLGSVLFHWEAPRAPRRREGRPRRRDESTPGPASEAPPG